MRLNSKKAKNGYQDKREELETYGSVDLKWRNLARIVLKVYET